MKAQHKFNYNGVDMSNPCFMTYHTDNNLYRILVYLRYDKSDNLIIKGSIYKRGSKAAAIDTRVSHKDNGGDPLDQPMILDCEVNLPYYVRFAADTIYDMMYDKNGDFVVYSTHPSRLWAEAVEVERYR